MEDDKMGFESRGKCPHCKKKIVMPKDQGGIFTCPECNCQFKHNRTKWIIAVPLVFVAAIIGYGYGNLGMMGALMFAVGIVAAFTGGLFQDYLILKTGIDISQLPQPDKIAKLKKKESLWVIVFMAILLLAVAVFMYYAIFVR
jgi:hypothetical protein